MITSSKYSSTQEKKNKNKKISVQAQETLLIELT